jgi:hypothetical protein
MLALRAFHPEGVDLGSQKSVCALLRVKLDDKWRGKKLGTTKVVRIV